jgi:tetratricopeptide (TPR) repeat protein
MEFHSLEYSSRSSHIKKYVQGFRKQQSFPCLIVISIIDWLYWCPDRLFSSIFTASETPLLNRSTTPDQINNRRGAPAFLCALMLLASCAAPLQQQAEATPGPAITQAQILSQNTDPTPAQTEEQATEEQVAKESSDPEYGNFPEDVLAKAIIAELAGQRGHDEQALNDYVTLARETRNLSIIQRTARISTFMRRTPVGTEMANLWLEQQPDSVEARQLLLQNLVGSGNYREAMAQLETLLDQGSDVEFRIISQRVATDPGADLLLDTLIADLEAIRVRYPQHRSLRLALIQLYQQNKQLQEAYEIARALAVELDDDPEVVVQEVRLLELLKEPERAQRRLQQSVETHPDNKQLRFMYGNRLLSAQRFAEAKTQFSHIIEQDPNDFDMMYSLALLNLQMNLFDEAAEYLQTLVKNHEHLDDSHFYLGNIYVQQSNTELAIKEYMLVSGGNNFLQAQRNLTELMIRADRYQEVKTRLQNIRFRNPDYNIPLLAMEASVLMDQQKNDLAATLLDSAVGAFPNNIQLLFLRSLLSQEINDLVLMEQDLRKIILLNPGDSTAYNSLGYTLADRTDRYQEAYELIQKAIELSPDEPSIIDSLGWVQYRLGMYEEARKNLDRAYMLFPDAEVAAHLGEVMWIMGDRAAANRVWHGALEKQPDSEHLLKTMERLNPDDSL